MNNNRTVTSIDRRLSERRTFRNLSRFPLNTRGGEWILSERRQLPCRRLNSIAAREAAYLDYVAAVIRSHV
jgi:hypothetical protein